MTFQPVLLSEMTRIGPDLAQWLNNGGGQGLLNALKSPETIIETIHAADLRGMGGAGFPTYKKWQAIADQNSPTKYIICNGNEDEPGTFKDRFLLKETPHQIIEGALIAAVATRANHVFIYVNPHQKEALESIELAIEQWLANPLLKAVEGYLATPLTLKAVKSSGRYIGGEETAVISTVEGYFPFPRQKPPYPFESGVNGEPSLVNNVETFAAAAHIIKNGAKWYNDLGIEEASGTKLYSLSGDILKPGLYELPMGTTLNELVFTHGGGMLSSMPFKAVFTGGPSNTLLTKNDLDVHMDFDSLKAKGSSLGTGAMIVISEGTSIVRKIAEYVDFFAAGSCGQCTSCKTGTYQLSRLLRRIDTGMGLSNDIRALENLCSLLPGSGRCALIDGAATIVSSSLNQFREEYEQQLMD